MICGWFIGKPLLAQCPSNMRFRYAFWTIVTCSICFNVHAKPLFEVGTEDDLKGWKKVGQDLASTLIEYSGDKAVLDEELAEKYQQLCRFVRFKESAFIEV